MCIARFVLAAWALAAIAGCAAPAAVAPEEGRVGEDAVLLESTSVFVEVRGDGENLLGVFLPAEWWEEEATPSAGDILTRVYSQYPIPQLVGIEP